MPEPHYRTNSADDRYLTLITLIEAQLEDNAVVLVHRLDKVVGERLAETRDAARHALVDELRREDVERPLRRRMERVEALLMQVLSEVGIVDDEQREQ